MPSDLNSSNSNFLTLCPPWSIPIAQNSNFRSFHFDFLCVKFQFSSFHFDFLCVNLAQPIISHCLFSNLQSAVVSSILDIAVLRPPWLVSIVSSSGDFESRLLNAAELMQRLFPAAPSI